VEKFVNIDIFGQDSLIGSWSCWGLIEKIGSFALFWLVSHRFIHSCIRLCILFFI